MKTRAYVIFAFLHLATSMVLASEYIVRPGDTLSNIAKTQLGSTTRWQEIATLNRLPSPYNIRPGQRLLLPSTTQAPQPASTQAPQPSETATKFNRPLGIWIWLPLTLFTVWGLTTVCLRIACWFSLVDTSFKRCSVLSLLSAGLFVVLLSLLAGLAYLVIHEHAPPITLPISTTLLAIAYIAISVLLTKRILQCKWRSVVTVGVMSGLVADILAVGLMALLFVALPELMATESLRGFVTAILQSQ